ncbi:MAG: oligosaccharide flippase family protein [Bacilli bacterium]
MSIRIKSTLFTITSAVVYQLVILLSGFLVRRAFLEFIGVYYLGFDGFFNTIISLLSLLDLGIGASSIFYISKAIAKNNIEEVILTYRVYAGLYRKVAFIMTIIGIIICLNISNFVELGENSLRFMQIIFLLQFSKTVSNYLLICPRITMQCNQKNYINIAVDTISALVFMIVKLIVLFTFKNYVAYLIVMLLELVITNLFIRVIFYREFPQVRIKQKVSKEITANVLAYAKSIIFSNINDFVYRSTDNLVITYFLGFTDVGYMSNYYYVFNAIDAMFAQFYLSVAASVTNFIHDDNVNEDENISKLFYIVLFVGFVMTLFCSIFLFGLTNEFIGIAFGQKYVKSKLIVFVMTCTFMLIALQTCLYMYISGKGLMKYEIKFSIVCTILNLTTSIYLVQKIGVLGVLIGTLLSTILFFSMRSRLVVNKIIHNPKLYIKTILKYISIIIISIFILQFILISDVTNFVSFIFRGITCFIVFIFMLLPFINTIEFLYLKKEIVSFFKKTKSNKSLL